MMSDALKLKMDSVYGVLFVGEHFLSILSDSALWEQKNNITG